MRQETLQLLPTFLAVARRRSFSRAAAELGISPSAASQAVRQLESRLGIALLARTTRSVGLTEAGARLFQQAAPALAQAAAALEGVGAARGELTGRLRLTVPRIAVPLFIESVVPRFIALHPRVAVHVSADDRLVDIVAEEYDAGIRLSEAIERDMVQLRLSKPFRFVVVGAPAYLARKGVPRRPEDLLAHDCLGYRSATTGDLYAWELEQGRRTWKVPVRGPLTTNDAGLLASLAVQGHGLAYLAEPQIARQLRARRLRVVLDAYAPMVPGFFLYYPSRAQRSPALHAFIDIARDVPGVSISFPR